MNYQCYRMITVIDHLLFVLELQFYLVRQVYNYHNRQLSMQCARLNVAEEECTHIQIVRLIIEFIRISYHYSSVCGLYLNA